MCSSAATFRQFPKQLDPRDATRGCRRHASGSRTLTSRRLTKYAVCGLVRFYGPASLREGGRLVTINLNFEVATLRLFRAIYATLAVYYYCPPRVNGILFKAEIQGHRMIATTTDKETLRSYTASRHYDDYAIADPSGNVDGRRGLRLGEPGVQVLEVLQTTPEPVSTAPTKAPMPKPKTQKPAKPKPHYNWRISEAAHKALAKDWTLIKDEHQSEVLDRVLAFAGVSKKLASIMELPVGQIAPDALLAAATTRLEALSGNLKATADQMAQGSQFGHTFVVIPAGKGRGLSPELVYTALTRASRHSTLLIERDIRSLIEARRRENAQTPQINSSLFSLHVPKPLLLDRRSWYEAGKIHEALSGDMVRSKSEVIISNLLHQNEVPFFYEQLLLATDGTMRLPDFTVSCRGETYYWEHLGLLDKTTYADEWARKRAVVSRTACHDR